jgi:lactose/L-arabinose transport system permease protein
MAKTTLTKKINLFGWLFVIPADMFISLNFYPMVSAFLLSLQSGRGNNLKFAGLKNFARLFRGRDVFTSVGNVITYLVIQVPVMLLLRWSSPLAQRRNSRAGNVRTLIFLPCATSLVHRQCFSNRSSPSMES